MEKKKYLKHEDWSIDVRKAINSFIAKNGKDASGQADSSYVVFDFDNTISIFDVEEQLIIYQLEYMAFAIRPEEMPVVLATGLADLDEDLSSYGYGKGSYADWIDDITKAYIKIYNRYGPFEAKGLTEEESLLIRQDDDWKEFAVKIAALYDLIEEKESAIVAYPSITYWFIGMSEQEIYDLAFKSHAYYSKVKTARLAWKSPVGYQSKVGPIEYHFTNGVQVSESLKELLQALNDNGIHTWICSASYIDVVRAAVDYFGLHDNVTGVLAMTNKMVDGKVISQYDFDNGCGYRTIKGSLKWQKESYPTHAQTQAEGKVEALLNTLCVQYGQGPLAGFMDSTGDFNFCSEFASLQLVVCFNRANREVTDGGGLIGELAIYQRDYLGYDFNKACDNGDTYYVLQGRDETAYRKLISSNSSLRINEKEKKLFANEENYQQLQYMVEHKLSTKDILNTFAMKTNAEEPNNVLGIKYGFLEEYRGYHSIIIKDAK